MSRPKTAEELTRIAIAGLASGCQDTTDPAPVIARMRELAGDHEDWFLEEAGNWAGYVSRSGVLPHQRPLVEAILATPGTEEAVELGRRQQRSYPWAQGRAATGG